MSENEQIPSYVECVAETLSQSPAPMSISSIIAAVEKLRPPSKSTRSAVYRAIGKLYQAVAVETGRYGWLSKLLEGVAVRHPLAVDECRRGYLMLDELEHAVFCPEFFQTQRPAHRTLSITLLGGPTITARTHVERRTWSIYMGKAFVEWIDQLGGQERDDVIITVEDAVEGRYGLRLQPKEVKDKDVVRDRNIQLALAAEDIAEADRRVRTFIPTAELVAQLIARGHLYNPSPPDDLHYVLDQFSMLHFVEGHGYTLDIPATLPFAADYGISRHKEGQSRADAFDSADFDYIDEYDEMEEGFEWDDDGLGESPPLPRPGSASSHDLADQFGDTCGAYELYLEQFQEAERDGAPLTHAEFHLLEAELEYLVALEVEFGGLLAEQRERKEELSMRLFIDPDAWPNDDFDIPDYPDYEDPPYWEN